MQFPTNLLSIFSQHNGTQALDDSVLEIPRTLVPVIQLPTPVTQVQDSFFTDTVNDTVHISQEFLLTNTTSQNLTMVIMAPGVWEIQTELATAFSGTTILSKFARIYGSFEGTASLFNIINFYFVNGVHCFLNRRFTVSARVRYSLNLLVSATAVGETVAVHASSVCNRLG